ncbi:MAG: hypothetical protein M1812_001187 [Candelaria pacifica]|nr:MAG: hypothetical protein M1812_001187 [Candelaria pacifica]
MDHYADIIPDDFSGEIRKRLRERDGDEPDPRHLKRQRADTNTLIPEHIEGDLTTPPLPEADLERYDRERLNRGLNYIKQAANRRITPRTEVFLELAKEAYNAALDTDAPNDKSVAVVQTFDEIYNNGAFFFKDRTPEDYEQLMHYVRLRRMELRANYGDYLGQTLGDSTTRLKAEAETSGDEVKNAYLELGPPRSYVDMADELEGTSPDSLLKNVRIGCGILGMDSEHMQWVIKEWGGRNRQFHNRIREHITACHWGKVAEQVCRDIKELLTLGLERELQASYEKTLIGIRDEYFDAVDREDFEDWLPNARAIELNRAKREREAIKAARAEGKK